MLDQTAMHYFIPRHSLDEPKPIARYEYWKKVCLLLISASDDK